MSRSMDEFLIGYYYKTRFIFAVTLFSAVAAMLLYIKIGPPAHRGLVLWAATVLSALSALFFGLVVIAED